MNITNINNCSAIEQQPNSSKSTSIMALPNEIIENIFVHLDTKKIVQSRLVCERFIELIDNESGKCSQKIKVEKRYKKLYSESHTQANNIVVDNYQQRFNQWLQSLSIIELKNNSDIIQEFGIHEQYYKIAKLASYDNNYAFQEIKQFKIDEYLKHEIAGGEYFFRDFHLTNDQNVYFFTTRDKFFLWLHMIDNRSEATLNIMSLVAKIGMKEDFPITNFLLIDDFITYVSETTHLGVIQKKIAGVYTDVTDPLFINNECRHISYLGKKDGNVNFLIQINDSFYVIEENKLAYSLNNTESNYWKTTQIFNCCSAMVTTSENGLIIIKENYLDHTNSAINVYKDYLHNPYKQIHIYKYIEKIASISLTDEEKQKIYFFGKKFTCNNQGTSFTIEKFNESKGNYLSVYTIQDNKIEFIYNTIPNLRPYDNEMSDVKYSPCGNFIEVSFFKLIKTSETLQVISTKKIYSLLDKKECLEGFIFASAFNNTGFLYAAETVIEDKKTITIYSCENQQMQVKTTINCTNGVMDIKFSPNSQFVAAMELNSDGEVQAIKVYQIFKLQQDGTVEFAPINQDFITEVFAEINTEEIIDFKFHPDGFKIIVITEKAIKIFCLT